MMFRFLCVMEEMLFSLKSAAICAESWCVHLPKSGKQSCQSCLSIRADRESPCVPSLPPTRVFLSAVAPSPHTGSVFNLRESQYPRREQAERSDWSQDETESLLGRSSLQRSACESSNNSHRRTHQSVQVHLGILKYDRNVFFFQQFCSKRESNV